jgi:AraC-like DNA-binding protein
MQSVRLSCRNFTPHSAFRPTTPGHLQHVSSECIPRHVHDVAFATVVLAGGYVEAGDNGRCRAEPGDVLFHRPYDYHLNLVGCRGARVIVIPHDSRVALSFPYGRLRDPDRVARLGEEDIASALEETLIQVIPHSICAEDWPDLLASAIRDNPSLRLSDWARAYGIALGSISRGFKQVYGVTPATYRLVQRTHRALDALSSNTASLGAIAQHCGFTDQAHMTHVLRRFTSTTPRALLKRLGRRHDSARMRSAGEGFARSIADLGFRDRTQSRRLLGGI